MKKQYIYKLGGYLMLNPCTGERWRVRYKNPIAITNPEAFKIRRNRGGKMIIDLKNLTEIPVKK